jgi:hypothetical protein
MIDEAAATRKASSEATEMPLDGTHETWWVQAQGRAYGPYTRTQIARFIGEGRVSAATLVSNSDRGEWREARNTPSIAAALADDRTNFKPAPGKPAEAAEANVIIYGQMMGGTQRAFEQEMRCLGACVEVTEGFYILRTRHTAGAIRNALSQALSRGDKFIVVDATRERLAWFNLGPEVDVKIRDVWNAAIPAQR